MNNKKQGHSSELEKIIMLMKQYLCPALLLDAYGQVIYKNKPFVETISSQDHLIQEHILNCFKKTTGSKNISRNDPFIQKLANQPFISEINNQTIQWITTQNHLKDNSSVYLLLCHVLNITNKLDEESLTNILIDNVPAQIFWKDTNLVYLGCNQEFVKSLKLTSKNEVIGKNDFELPVSKINSEKYRKDDKSVMLSKKPKLNIEEQQTLASGEIKHLLTSKVPLFNADEEVIGVLAVYTDITKLKQLQEYLNIEKDKAEAANQAKTKFIANMSHDLRTPLSGIVGISEILQDHAPDPDTTQYAMWIHDCSQQLLGLLNGILDIVKLGNTKEEEIELTTFDFRQCIDELAQLEMPTIKLKGLDLQIEIDEDIPQFIQTDRIKIHRIILNLLGNAIKFTEAGHVAINVKLINQTKDEVTLYFAVSDTGIGIPEDQQAQVFDRFHRVNASFEGTYTGHGIGLHIAQSYVKRLGGDIQLSSKPDVGTSCYFELTFKIGQKEEVINTPPNRSDTKKLNASKATDSIERSS